MKFYVASAITNKREIQEIFADLTALGHEVTTDWTLTDDIPASAREAKGEYVRAIAKRDYEGIKECDVFVLLTRPAEGRSMYVELGLALALLGADGRPKVFVLGPENTESVFYYHPLVQRAETWEQVLAASVNLKAAPNPPESQQGRLEEYRALREEMLELIKERVWGQATYAALSAGILALMKDTDKVAILIFTILLV